MNIDITKYVAIVLFLVGVLVVATNIITEVLKRLLWEKLPTNILATIVSMAVTLCSFFAYCSANAITILWYYVAGSVVLGIFVAYAAMFGYDKFKEILEKLGK